MVKLVLRALFIVAMVLMVGETDVLVQHGICTPLIQEFHLQLRGIMYLNTIHGKCLDLFTVVY